MAEELLYYSDVGLAHKPGGERVAQRVGRHVGGEEFTAVFGDYSLDGAVG